MEKLILIKNGEVHELNKELREGWTVKQMTAVPSVVATGASYSTTGDIYLYVLITKN